MAEAAVASTAASAVTGGWTKHVTCRYFMHGLCKEGDNCRYSHDLTNSKPAAMICKFFQKGNCVFGDRCRFEHCKPAKNEELPTPQTLPLPSVSLAGPSDPEPSGPTPGPGAQDWVNAAEFVPGQPYCGRAEPVKVESSIPLIEEFDSDAALDNKELRKQLCPYAAVGECRYGINCAYLHGDVCDMCGLQVLHPTDNTQRSDHTKACIEAHEKDMEISFAIQRSKDMMCGVCMEVVFEKANPSERRFGILSNCSHCYCLKCIRKWRSAKQFESKIIKSCPECRITSNFVIPSEYWVEDKDDKQKLIQKYKDGMGSKPCRYFDEGRGTCPFGSNCFYRHAFPDGRLEEAQPQRRQTGSNSRNRVKGKTYHRTARFGTAAPVIFYVQPPHQWQLVTPRHNPSHHCPISSITALEKMLFIQRKSFFVLNTMLAQLQTLFTSLLLFTVVLTTSLVPVSTRQTLN